MWHASRPKFDEDLLALFTACGRNVQRATTLLCELVSDFPERSELATEILACEHEGDRFVHDLLHVLAENGRPRSFDAADVHRLAGALDDIVDYAEEVAARLNLYRVEATLEQAQEVSEVLVLAADGVAAALCAWQSGADVSGPLADIHRLETEADRIVREAIASLFAIGIDPMMVIRWKDIFELLEASVDACETVANVLEGIALKQATIGR